MMKKGHKIRCPRYSLTPWEIAKLQAAVAETEK
jgi:hypothetical protein